MTIEVTIETNPFQVTNDIQNFKVEPVEFDFKMPTGYGSTREGAIQDFIESWMLKYDEEVELTIIEK